ncbi:MAG: HEAT repeat domain-containing protein, partial [Planctomycetota bacterium]
MTDKPDRQDRVAAVMALGADGSPDAREQLRATLADDTDAYAREAAARVLGGLQDFHSLHALIAATRDDRRRVRDAACEALAQIGGPDALNALRQRRDDANEYDRVRQTATRAVAQLERGPAAGSSPLAAWEPIGTETLAANPFWQYRRDRVRLPDGAEHAYHYVHTPGSVMIVAIDTTSEGDTNAGELLLVEQYRYLQRETCLELPGGGIKSGMLPADAARDELREETGYDADVLDEVGWFTPCKGLTDERCHVFVASGLRP